VTAEVPRRVHVVEPGGRGGIHQHAVALARALVHAGVDVTLYTAADHEPLPSVDGPGGADEAGLAAIRYRACLWRFTGVRPRPLRRAAVVIGWLGVGIPACLARVRAGDVVHLQGWFKPVLLVPLAVGARLRRAAFVYSPHTSYSRWGTWPERVVRRLARRADVVFAFSEADQRSFAAWGARVVPAPFPFVVPPPDATLVAGWRRRWLRELEGAGGRVALLPGQMRPDKGLELAVLAVARTGNSRLVLALVGDDLGALAPARHLAEELGVRVVWDEGFQPLEQFVAAIAAADVVVCPYRVASQSGVLALAHALGRPTVATDVGGLPELATVIVPTDDPTALAGGLRLALEGPPPVPSEALTPAAVAEAYLAAYRLALASAVGAKRRLG
jgi:glycosyltransferase involved in cell wall biosynthesis